MAEDM